MKVKKLRTVVAAAAVAAPMLAMASTAPVSANNSSTYSGHWICSGCSSHSQVVYEGSWTGYGEHYHKYKHDVSWGSDHHPWKQIY